MAEEQFKPGDVVQLKSGGPHMTIESVGRSVVSEQPTVVCVWFEGTAQHRETFATQAVEISATSSKQR